MAKFTVPIDGERLSQAMAALNGAGVPVIGTTAWYGDQPPPDQDLYRLRAVVEAETADEAVVLVKNNLPDDPTYTVGPAGRYGPRWACDMRIRTTPGTVASLITWLEQTGTGMEDAEAAIARWDVDNPGQIVKPE